MTDYEQLRRRHLADAMAIVPGMIDRLSWPADRLAAHRTAALRELVGTAVSRSPWHRKRLGHLAVDALRADSLDELPTMTKADMMEHFGAIVTDERLGLDVVNAHLESDGLATGSYLFDRYTAIASGGSTGRRGVFVYDRDGWSVFYVGVMRWLFRAMRDDPELGAGRAVMANVTAAHPTHATAAFNRTFTGPHLRAVRFPVTLPTEDIVAGLNATQPTFLHAYSSALHLLASEAAAGRLRIAPRRVFASSEPLLPEIRAAAEEAWGVPVGNWWGCSEAGPMGISCEAGSVHLSEDLMIVEPVDEAGNPVAPGERAAKLLLTNLYNHALPLIRYELTDEVLVLPEPCRCGAAHRCVADLQGRLDDTFAYGSRAVHPHVFRSHLGRRAGIVEYQVRQTERGADIALRCTGPVDLDALRGELEEALIRLGLHGPEIRLQTVDRLERQIVGKLKRFVPLAEPVPAPA
jgi:phenylacetate-coenzyme A ligase PaaK-like adenylate-forming protein